MKVRSLAVAAVLAALGGAALAQGTNTPTVDQRQANQQARIDQGVASGQLNQKEANRLEKGQDRVANAEAKAKADGTVTAKERAKLQHMQNKQSRHIAKQKHDKQTAN